MDFDSHGWWGMGLEPIFHVAQGMTEYSMYKDTTCDVYASEQNAHSFTCEIQCALTNVCTHATMPQVDHTYGMSPSLQEFSLGPS